MTKSEVKAKVVEIRNLKNDPEAAHALETKLHADVLVAIANGSVHPEDASGVARMAVETLKVRFTRRTA